MGALVERQTRTLVSGDRKSTRLNSSHQIISYAVLCLKKIMSAALGLFFVLDPKIGGDLSRWSIFLRILLSDRLQFSHVILRQFLSPSKVQPQVPPRAF